MLFVNGLATSAVGGQTTDLMDATFERLRHENNDALLVIANAFDVAIRRDHATERVPLDRAEPDRLNRLATGLTRKQVAWRLRARDGLKAPTVARAIAIATVFGLARP